MTESLDENILYEDIFNSYMSKLCAKSRQHINSSKSNKTESDHDTNEKSIDKHNIKKIRTNEEKKTIKINNHFNNIGIRKQ